ncbi:hypothetical protein MIMGU_mgv11b022743mg [Erythranthe guttata]|uniref:Cdc6 C-terminal domain-containing protein n=1 Tax=Erythranthe guttata TaxID=4155 RepID=A0A022RRB6_ERYGU|nr:hypothetical protein MIMGU_mgv11b022743mg [Erythranthe guttata]
MNGDQQNPAPLDITTNNMVRIDHVAAALSRTYKSSVVDTIQSLPQHQQIILCSAVKLFRGGKKDTTIGELNKSYTDVCKSASIPPVVISELLSMCQVLDDQVKNRNITLLCINTKYYNPISNERLHEPYPCDIKLQGILKLGQARDDKLKRVTLKIDGADIVFALQGVRFFRNCLE